MDELLAIVYSFIAVGIFAAAVAGLCVQGQALIVPGWRADHWAILKNSAEQHWFTSRVKLSAQELEVIQGASTRWETERDDPFTTLKERCVMAVACRGLEASGDRVHQLERCANALHRRALRKSGESINYVLPRANSIRRWEWLVYREIWKAWMLGVRSGFRETCQNVIKNLTALMGVWATIALILAMPSWLVVSGRAEGEVEFIDFIGAITAWGGVVGAIHGLGQIWYDATKRAGVHQFSSFKFGVRVAIAFIACVVFAAVYEYIGDSEIQGSISTWLGEKVQRVEGWVFGFLVLGGILLWIIYVMWTWVRSSEVVASDRVSAGVSMCLYVAMAIIFAIYFLQAVKLIPEESAFEYIQKVSISLVLVLFIGFVVVLLLRSIEHIQRVRDLRHRGVEVRVRGYSLKYLVLATLGVLISFALIFFVEKIATGWMNEIQGFILVLSLMAIFFLSFLAVSFEGAMLAIKFRRVSLSYRRAID